MWNGRRLEVGICGIAILLALTVMENRGKFELLDSTRYLKLEEQYSFLESLERKASSVMTLQSIGNTSIEGKPYQNDIYLVTIKHRKKAPILFFDCGAHAREWISSATCLYLIQELASAFIGARKNKNFTSPLLNYEWQFVPMLNPDGYNYTHQGKDKRMHRKNTRPVSSMKISQELKDVCKCDDKPEDCLGVDLNRNFPSGWGMGNTKFMEDNSLPCIEFFKGPHPLSEPETIALDKHVNSLKGRILSGIAIHSYGKEIYYPKGYLNNTDPDQLPPADIQYMKDFARFINKDLKFGVGNVFSLLGWADVEGGTTDDYYYDDQHINISYTIELDPQVDDFAIGFELPPEKIISVGEKMWRALLYMATKFDLLYPQNKRRNKRKQ